MTLSRDQSGIVLVNIYLSLGRESDVSSFFSRGVKMIRDAVLSGRFLGIVVRVGELDKRI